MLLGKEKFFLTADVGGTKTDIAIMDREGKVLARKHLISKDIKNFTDALAEFLSQPDCRQYKTFSGCIALAGQINQERTEATLTNLDWKIDSSNILARTHLHKVILLNDFEAIALGARNLAPQDTLELTNLGRGTPGSIAIIGAGTGLGISIIPDKESTIIRSEGGHVDIPIDPRDKIEKALMDFLLKKKLYRDAEDIVSGRGIVNIYRFLLTKKMKHDSKIRSEISKAPDTDKPAIITKYALEDKDALCIRTLEMFTEYYARVSRNLVLTVLPSELLIAGGIAPKIASAMQDIFVDEFVKHDIINMRKILEMTPVSIITNADVGLQGALSALKS